MFDTFVKNHANKSTCCLQDVECVMTDNHGNATLLSVKVLNSQAKPLGPSSDQSAIGNSLITG